MDINLPYKVQNSWMALYDYLYEEEKHYNEMVSDGEDVQDHIWHHIQEVNAFMDAFPILGELGLEKFLN